MSGKEIPFKRPVPEYRSIVNGVWSDIQDAWVASFEGTGANSEIRVSDKSLEAPLERGLLKGYSKTVNIENGKSVSIYLTPSTDFTLIEASGKNLEIRYVTTAGGTVDDIGDMLNLNFSVNGSTPVFYQSEFDVTYSDSDILIGGVDSVKTPIAFDNSTNFHVVFTNNTGQDYFGLISLTGKNANALEGNFGITGNTNLTAATEMSTYNGAN